MGQRLRPRGLLRGPHRPYRPLHRLRRIRRDHARRPHRRRHRATGRCHLADQPGFVGTAGRHSFGRTHQGHPGHLPERHPLRHVDRLVRADHAVRRMRVEEGRLLGRDDELRLAQQIERPTARHPLHGGDHRLPQVVRLRPDRDQRIVDRVRGRGLRHLHVPVEPRTEGPPARARHDDGPHLVIEAERPPDAAQFIRRRQIDRVQLLGPVEGDDRDPGLLVGLRPQCHRRPLIACLLPLTAPTASGPRSDPDSRVRRPLSPMPRSATSPDRPSSAARRAR